MKKKIITLTIAIAAAIGGTSCVFAHHGGGHHYNRHYNTYYNNECPNYQNNYTQQPPVEYNGCGSDCWHYGPHTGDCPYYEQSQCCQF